MENITYPNINLEKLILTSPDSNQQILKFDKLNLIIDEYLENLNKLNLNFNPSPNIKIVSTKLEFLEMTQLRSKVFSPINGFNLEFPEMLKGLQYDLFDTQSINLIHKTENKIDGTIRILLDSKLGLQTQKQFPKEISNLRKNSNLAELTRLAIDPNSQGGTILKQLYQNTSQIKEITNTDNYIGCMTQQLYHKVYEKFGMQIEKTIPSYGKLNYPCYITSWTKDDYTKFYKTKILGEKN